MTVLYVPAHLPIKQTLAMIQRETAYRDVIRVEVVGNFLEIEHERMSRENVAEMLSCIEGPIIVMSIIAITRRS